MHSSGIGKTPSRIGYGLNESVPSELVNSLLPSVLDRKQRRSSDALPLEHNGCIAPSAPFQEEECSVYPRADRRSQQATSMETEYGALCPTLSQNPGAIEPDYLQDKIRTGHPYQSDGEINSSSESDDMDYDDGDSSDDHPDDEQSEDFDGDLDVYAHGDFLSSQEAILMELRREQVEFEENVRQLQQQLQRQGSILSQSAIENTTSNNMAFSNTHANPSDSTSTFTYDCNGVHTPDGLTGSAAPPSALIDVNGFVCDVCVDPKPTLCLEKYGWVWRPLIIEALATAAAAIANICSLQHPPDGEGDSKGSVPHSPFRYNDLLPKHRRSCANGSTHSIQPGNG